MLPDQIQGKRKIGNQSQKGPTFLYEDVPIMRKAFRILLFLARVVANPKAFKDTLEVRLPMKLLSTGFTK